MVNERLTLEDTEKVKDLVLEYANYTDSLSKQETLRINDLLHFLESQTGISIAKIGIESLMFDVYFPTYGSKGVSGLVKRIRTERNSLERVAQLIGEKVSEIDESEIEEKALKVFSLGLGNYKSQLNLKADPTQTLLDYKRDSTLLLGVLKVLHGITIDYSKLKEVILNGDFPTLKDTENFRREFQEGLKHMPQDYGPLDLLETFLNCYTRNVC